MSARQFSARHRAGNAALHARHTIVCSAEVSTRLLLPRAANAARPHDLRV